MTRDEFLHNYHYYQTQSKDDARAEANKVNMIGIEGYTAVVVGFPNQGYCLMLDSAVDFCLKIGIPLEMDDGSQ